MRFQIFVRKSQDPNKRECAFVGVSAHIKCMDIWIWIAVNKCMEMRRNSIGPQDSISIRVSISNFQRYLIYSMKMSLFIAFSIKIEHFYNILAFQNSKILKFILTAQKMKNSFQKLRNLKVHFKSVKMKMKISSGLSWIYSICAYFKRFLFCREKIS